MRVVIVNPVWDGALASPEQMLARYTTLTGWASAVLRSGVESVTVCQRFSSTATLVQDGVTYRFCADRRRPTPRWSTRGTALFHQTVLDTRPDLVHVNGLLFPELTRGLRAALPERVALVVQDHGGFDPAEASAFTRIWLRRGLAAADAVLISSTGQADALRQHGIASPETMVADVMESSTTLRRVSREHARAELGVGGEPSLLWVGRLNENKDPVTVLAGFARWAGQHPRATLTMAFHGGELNETVRQMVASTPSLAKHVTLVGAVPHDRLAAYYSAADLFVLGSHHEGSGYAAIEAVACGAIPVVTDIAPFRALTDDGAIGALWEPGNSDSLVAALNRVMLRAMDAQQQAARDRFERFFSWEMIGRRAVAIYREVMTSRGLSREPARSHTRA